MKTALLLASVLGLVFATASAEEPSPIVGGMRVDNKQ